MESGENLGIYLGRHEATVVCLGPHGKSMPGCFSIAVENPEEPDWQMLAAAIAKGCAERGLKFTNVAVALDCGMFMQYDVRSEFDNARQIASTIRFDTEEVIATDISDVAIAFKIILTDSAGSQLAVFTAQQKILSEIIASLQSNRLDPITIEPDVNCLSRFIRKKVSLPQGKNPFFGLFSRHNGYFIYNSSSDAEQDSSAFLRTFLVGPAHEREKMLMREVPITMALLKTAEPINCFEVADSTETVKCSRLSASIGTEVENLDMAGCAGADVEKINECSDVVEFAIAYGAALGSLEKVQTINFRNDFLPYEGKKAKLEKKAKILSVIAAVMMVALGVYFQNDLFEKSKPISRIREKFTKDYSSVMLGEKRPAKSKNALQSLNTELRRIKALKSGQIGAKGEKSISAKLTMVLEAFNSCAKETKLDIESISITSKMIKVDGSTSSRAATIKLRKALTDSNLQIMQDRLEKKGERDTFIITIAPEKTGKAS